MFTSSTVTRAQRTPSIDWQGATTASAIDALSSPADVSLVTVFAPTIIADRTFNFHPCSFQSSDGRVHLAHTTHDTDEEGPGTYVRYHYSDDNGATWTEATTPLLPQLVPSASAGGTLKHTPLPVAFVEINTIVYCVLDVVYRNPDPSLGLVVLAVPVVAGVPGIAKIVHRPDWTAQSGYTQYTYDAILGGEVIREINFPHGVSWGMGFDDVQDFRIVIPEGVLVEHSKVKVAGGWMRFSRIIEAVTADDVQWLWASFSTDGVEFGTPWKTNAPNATSRTCVKKMSDRYVLITNANNTSRRGGIAGYSLDGLTWTATDTEKILDAGDNIWSPAPASSDTAGGWAGPWQPYWYGSAKGGQTSYFHITELANGKYLTTYGERGKEVIRVATWTPKSMS
tara:strand:+ start:2236 stop:3423 length:1188 start_codon:yes stop_codon:yes gene_type:complete